MLLGLTADWLHVIVSVAVLVFVIVSIAVFGTLALARRRARLPVRYRFGPVGFRLHPVRLRFRLWQLIAAILVLGALLELVIVARRAFHAYQKAEEHANSAESYRSFQDPGSLVSFWVRLFGGRPWDPWVLKHFRAMERYHERMSQKYYDVARHPWRSVSPDPPEPKWVFD